MLNTSKNKDLCISCGTDGGLNQMFDDQFTIKNCFSETIMRYLAATHPVGLGIAWYLNPVDNKTMCIIIYIYNYYYIIKKTCQTNGMRKPQFWWLDYPCNDPMTPSHAQIQYKAAVSCRKGLPSFRRICSKVSGSKFHSFFIQQRVKQIGYAPCFDKPTNRIVGVYIIYIYISYNHAPIVFYHYWVLHHIKSV